MADHWQYFHSSFIQLQERNTVCEKIMSRYETLASKQLYMELHKVVEGKTFKPWTQLDSYAAELIDKTQYCLVFTTFNKKNSGWRQNNSIIN